MRTPANKNDRREARAWLVLQGIRQIEIMEALGHKSVNQVHSTLHGFRNDRRVLQFLVEKGCPVGYLNLPEDMLKAA